MFPRRLVHLFIIFLLINGIGVMGYHWIEGWTWLESIWMVLITFSTIGFGEVHPLSDNGRLFSIVMIIGGLSFFSYSLTQLTSYIMEGDFRRDLKEHRRKQLMSTLHNHHIVAGFGRLGREVSMELVHHGKKIVVIDESPEAIEQIEAAGFTAIKGDASRDEVLFTAGIERAEGFAIATSSNAVNILVTLSARQLNPGLMILTRVDSEEAASKAMRAGASSVLVPHGLAGVHMAHGLLRPEARTFLDLAMTRTHGELALEDVEVASDGRMNGTLQELRLRDRFGITIVAVREAGGQMMTMPGPNTKLSAGDIVVIIGRPEDIQDFADCAAGIERKKPKSGLFNFKRKKKKKEEQ